MWLFSFRQKAILSKKEDCNCRYSDIGYPDKAESCIPRKGNRQRIEVCRLHSRFNLHRRGRCDALRNPAERNYDFSASGLAVTPSEIEQYGKVTVKFRLDSWDRNLPDEDNINGRQHIQSGKYFRYQKDVQALKTTAGAAAGVTEVARVAGVSLVGVLSGLGYTLLKRKKLF